MSFNRSLETFCLCLKKKTKKTKNALVSWSIIEVQDWYHSLVEEEYKAPWETLIFRPIKMLVEGVRWKETLPLRSRVKVDVAQVSIEILLQNKTCLHCSFNVKFLFVKFNFVSRFSLSVMKDIQMVSMKYVNFHVWFSKRFSKSWDKTAVGRL